MLKLVEEARVREKLHKIITTLTADRALHDDLMQESLIHMWRTENEKPGHTRSWYLQNCRYHLLHWLSSGRSLDSPKRCKCDQRVSIDVFDDGLPSDGYHTNGELFAEVCVNDIVSTLARQLKPCEIVVLTGLADGLRLREIAVRLKRAYPTVLAYRRKIARLALRLGLSPAYRESESAAQVSGGNSSIPQDCRGGWSLPTRATLPRTTTRIPPIERLDRARQDSEVNISKAGRRARSRFTVRQTRTVDFISQDCSQRR